MMPVEKYIVLGLKRFSPYQQETVVVGETATLADARQVLDQQLRFNELGVESLKIYHCREVSDGE